MPNAAKDAYSPSNDMAPHGLAGALMAILLQRCPRCRKGRMFRGLLTMNDPCPVCGLLFQREEGSFLGAMYISYVLSSVIAAVFFFIFVRLLPDWNGQIIALLAMLPYLFFVPSVYRYSRAIWVHLDRAGDFTDVLAGAYEKDRLSQLAEHSPQPPGISRLPLNSIEPAASASTAK